MPGKALELKSQPLELIRAGAGAGKTTALINTLIKCIKSHHAETKTFPRVAVSTFTRKATRELKERLIIKALNFEQDIKNRKLTRYISHSPSLQISTLHGIFHRFIQTQGYRTGFSPGLTLMTEKQNHELFTSLLKDIMLEQKTGVPLLDHYSFAETTNIVKQYVLLCQSRPNSAPVSKKELHAVLTQKQKNSALKGAKAKKEPAELDKEEQHIAGFFPLCGELQKIGEKIIPAWTQKKQELSQITLNDLETMTLQILKQGLNKEEYKMDFWFLDEYQDTSPIQKNILNLLCKHSRVFIVGDPQQSIYRFRGADADLFMQKEREAEQNPNSKVKYLKTNYRSQPELIAFFNDFFPEKTFSKMKAKKETYQKEKEVARFVLPSQTTDDKQGCEFQKVRQRIKELLKKGAKPGEIAVLSRQNKALKELARYLKNPTSPNPTGLELEASPAEDGLPVHLHSAGDFKHRREITDALFLLRFLINPHDDENLIGLFRTPYCKIPDQKLANALREKTQEKHRGSVWRFLCEQKKFGSFPARILKLCLENTNKTGITHSFQKALFELGFMDLSYYQDPTGTREANLWKLIYCLRDYESREPVNLNGFADFMFYDNPQTESDQVDYSQSAVSAFESSGVQLMTVHSAKGLEFNHVILIKVCAGFRYKEGLQYFTCDEDTGKWTLSVRSMQEDKRIRSSFHKQNQEKQKERELKEFDRLLYVALTRAKKSVTLIGTGTPEKHSWPARFAFFHRLSPGKHSTNKYTYTVSL